MQDALSSAIAQWKDLNSRGAQIHPKGPPRNLQLSGGDRGPFLFSRAVNPKSTMKDKAAELGVSPKAYYIADQPSGHERKKNISR